MSMAMRTKIGDLSADNARGGGVRAGVYWGAGVQHSHKRPPINSLYFPSNVLFYFSNLSLTYLTRLTYITTP